jgi:predicted PurR-regulated permease PerM
MQAERATAEGPRSARGAGLALVAAGASVGLAFFLRETAEVFVPFTVALLLALAAYPLVEWLGARKMPPPLSTALVVLLVLLLLGVAALLTEQGVDSLMGRLPEFKARASDLWTGAAKKLGVTAKPLEGLGKEPTTIRTIAGVGGSTALSVLNGAFQLLLVILYLIFLLLGRRHLPGLLRRAAGRDRARSILHAVERIEREMLRYLALRTIVSLLTAAAVGIILRLYGVQFAGLWALLTFFAQFVPFVGPLILSVLPVLLAVLQFPSLSTAAWIAGWLTLWHLFIGFVVEPRVFSIGLSLNQTLVLLGLALFGWMWGIVGALLWVPMMVALRLAAQQVPALHAVDVLLGRADGREPSTD